MLLLKPDLLDLLIEHKLLVLKLEVLILHLVEVELVLILGWRHHEVGLGLLRVLLKMRRQCLLGLVGH